MPALALLGGRAVRQTPFARWPVFDEREKAALLEVLASGAWGGYSAAVGEFEAAFARFQEASCAVAASNGTVSLEAALAAAGIQPGDEVIVPPISFIATATAVLRAGAVPVFADIDHASYNLDPARAGEAITARTRAMIPVHFAGHSADMDALMEIAGRRGLVVIEDAAHAHGASWRGRRLGTFGQFGSFSFQQSKNLTAGEGGILITNDESRAEAARSYCNQGRRRGAGWYEHFTLGTNCRLTGWQAAVLLVQLARLPEQLERRAANARFLSEQLSQLGVVEPPGVDERVTCHGYYLYMLRLPAGRLPGVSKARFVEALAAEGIPCAAGYPYPLYSNPVFEASAYRRGECPQAERMCAESFWVTQEIMLAAREDLGDFITAVAKVAEHAGELATAAAG